jgi:mitogen-activated protein kinase 1/3
MKCNKFTTKLYDIIICQDESQEKQSAFQFSHLFMIMEYMESDLRKILDKIPDQVQPFTPDHIVNLIYNVLCAINFMHSAGVMHRDIKPANILVNHDCSIRLCDFGLSRTVPQSKDQGLTQIKKDFNVLRKGE